MPRQISTFTLLLTLIILMIIGAALASLIDVTDTPKPRRGKTLTVTYYWPNTAAKVIETEVTSKIEGIMASVPGMSETSSESYLGRGVVRGTLKEGVDVAAAKFELSSTLRQIAGKLPQGCSFPEVSGGDVPGDASGGAAQRPRRLLTYTVNANMANEQIRDYLLQRVEPVISMHNDVRDVSISGSKDQYLEVSYDPVLLTTYGVSASEIADAIRNYIGKEQIIGVSEHTAAGSGGTERLTMLLATAAYRGSIGSTPIKMVGNKIVYLNDLATLTYQDRKPTSYYRINGMNTVYVNVMAAPDANILRLSGEVQESIAAIESLDSEGVHLTLVYDAAKDKRTELHKVITRTTASLVLLLLFVWLTTRSRVYLGIIALTLIANVLISFIAFYVFAVRLHTIALAGITVSLGLIIDASIVMVDHYSYYRDRKAFISILAALLTTIGALVLVFFMPSYMQSDLYDFASVIIINLTVALIVSWLFVPAIVDQTGYTHHKHIAGGRRKLSHALSWSHFYRRYISFTQQHKWVYCIALILIFGIPFHLLPERWDTSPIYEPKADTTWYSRAYDATFGSRYYNKHLRKPLTTIFGGTTRLFSESLNDRRSYADDDEQEMKLTIRAQMPLGGNVSELNDKVRMLEMYLITYGDRIKRFETSIDYTRAVIMVEFHDADRHSPFPYRLESAVIGRVLDIGGADWSTSGVSERGFSNSLNLQHRSNRISMSGYDYNRLYRYAEDMCEYLQQNPRVRDITIETPGHEYQEDELYVRYRPDRLSLYGVTAADVHASLQQLLTDRSIGHIPARDGANVEVMLHTTQAEDFDLWHLENAHIPVRASIISTEEQASDERVMYLPEFMDISKREANNFISKTNQEYVLRVAFNVLGSYNYTSKYIESTTKLFNSQLPIGYRCTDPWSRYQADEGIRYGLLLLVVVVIFFVCSILFESLRLPLVIISIIPVSFIGVFLTVSLTGVDFGTGGFASLVLLSGIVVNSGIYIISEYLYQCRKRSSRLLPKRGDNTSIAVATYIKAYNHKIIPVFLTITSTILGLLPLLIEAADDTFWHTFAVCTTGGLIFSFVSLIFVMPIFMPLRPKRNSNMRDAKNSQA